MKKTAKAIAIGIKNFKFAKSEVEELAKKRADKAKNCENFKDEPIDFLKVKDKRIPELSGKYCVNCGCVASFKFRQNISKCECWEEK